MAAAALPIILLKSEQPPWLTALTKLPSHQVSCSTLSCLLASVVGTMIICPHAPVFIHQAAHPVASLPALPDPRATNSFISGKISGMLVMGMPSWTYRTPRETSVILGLLLYMSQALQLKMSRCLCSRSWGGRSALVDVWGPGDAAVVPKLPGRAPVPHHPRQHDCSQHRSRAGV